MVKKSPEILRLIDMHQRPIRIIESEVRDSKLGPYMVMQDDRGRIILAGDSTFLAQYSSIPTPFYIMS